MQSAAISDDKRKDNSHKILNQFLGHEPLQRFINLTCRPPQTMVVDLDNHNYWTVEYAWPDYTKPIQNMQVNVAEQICQAFCASTTAFNCVFYTLTWHISSTRNQMHSLYCEYYSNVIDMEECTDSDIFVISGIMGKFRYIHLNLEALTFIIVLNS